MGSDITGDRLKNGYTWQSTDDSFFAHATPYHGWESPSWRGLCEATMGLVAGDHPSTSKAVGKPKCGLCLEELTEAHGATEKPGIVERREESDE